VEEEIAGVWKAPPVCQSGDIISPTIIKVQDIRLRIKTQTKRKRVPGTSEQKNIYSETGSKKAMSRSQLEGLKTLFNVAKDKSTPTNEEEDRILWAMFLPSPVLKYIAGSIWEAFAFTTQL